MRTRENIGVGMLIDGVVGRIDDAALREAQQAKDGVRAYELGYAALSAG